MPLVGRRDLTAVRDGAPQSTSRSDVLFHREMGSAVPFCLRRGIALPASPVLYLITNGGCLSHVGTSGKIVNRVRTLAGLGPTAVVSRFCAPRTALAMPHLCGGRSYQTRLPHASVSASSRITTENRRSPDQIRAAHEWRRAPYAPRDGRWTGRLGRRLR